MTNQAIFRNLGASNHSIEDRQSEDYYATEPKAAEFFCCCLCLVYMAKGLYW